MNGFVMRPPEDLPSLIRFLEDQLEIARALPGSSAQETRIGLITNLLDRARQVARIEEIGPDLLRFVGKC